ncbi:MAG: SUMF1/EgtB/PvdO family nonheme iron enzyme, partial [Planctomycetes bacterium]|nr:SUMF1/EgtB/PvdO family nonheme iron enzyme [Planctomycetota bacterium]
WEKAARGVDGRRYPWGDGFRLEFTNSIYSHPEGQKIVGVQEFPLDESPYGVRGMGGNVRDWCADVVPTNPSMRMARGGMWTAAGLLMRPANRVGNVTTRVSTNLGFRLALDL